MNDTLQAPILLFDGVCNLCSSSVQWVLKHDRRGIFRFAPLQSRLAQELLTRHAYTGGELGTVVLVADGRLYTHSDAVLELLRRIGGGWQLFYIGKLIPPFLRNAAYNLVARYRYRWFGKQETCWLPRPEWSDRFPDHG